MVSGGVIQKMTKSDDEAYKEKQDKQIRKFVNKFDRSYPPVKSDIRRDEIGGLEAIMDRIDDFQLGINNSRMYENMGITPPNGFILAGPPGTGKTYVAKYLAGDLGARFVDLPLNKFESKWVGDAEKKLAKIIDDMRDFYNVTGQKALLFFDEAEESFKARTSNGYHGPRVNVLLREMDGFGDNEGIIFGAATNHLDKVDGALLRAGRLDYIINMPDYDNVLLEDVIAAQQRRINRKAPYHNPFVLRKAYIPVLGEKAASKKLLPADVAEVFRLSAQTKIREMVASDKDMLTPDMYSVKGYEFMEELEQYDRNKGVSRPIGF